MEKIYTVNDVILTRRGYHISGTLILSSFHLVFTFNPNPSSSATNSQPKEIWICYPIIDRISKSRGSTWLNNSKSNSNVTDTSPPVIDGLDHYSASNIRLQCKDFTYYSFDFKSDFICTEVFTKLSSLVTILKTENNNLKTLYAFEYKPNMLEQNLELNGWKIYDPIKEYSRLGLITDKETYWRIANVNQDYKFCPSYPKILIIPSSISDNVLKHAGKFRSKQRIPAVVYKHNNINGNVIARCSQPLVGLNLQNRSIQDEKLIEEIFNSQEEERNHKMKLEEEEAEDGLDYQSQQTQRNLLVDLRPITNAMAQHALGAGTENVDNYKGKTKDQNENGHKHFPHRHKPTSCRQVEKIFCNIDNIHVMRDSLNKLNTILNDLDKYPINKTNPSSSMLQQQLSKTQWLHRLSIILQSVDRIIKSIHLNNTNVIIHCSDGWDRTSQVSALAQLCLDPYYRTIEGFIILIVKEWVSFGFKFNTRADHGGCIGAIMKKEPKNIVPQSERSDENPLDNSMYAENIVNEVNNSGATSSVASFLQKAAKAARDIKNSAQNGLNLDEQNNELGNKFNNPFGSSTYNGSSEKSPIFHQFLDCVYQIMRQNGSKFEFNSRFLKRLLYHYYSCQYGTFLCNSEREYEEYKMVDNTISIWDYFNSRPNEFKNQNFKKDNEDVEGVLFFNFADIKWWFELYGRSDEEMNGLSNSLDRKFAQMSFKKEKSTE
ncbi:unnamed protein product [Candida verbasci]|uniref:Myotubularin phosphatase domain-containing protein n=1 Tax=Candida verbasci TaxID=1227364 RepID=A0A9W4TST9_9ASCO|nr:unnamed protein product [Candida verbasci]